MQKYELTDRTLQDPSCCPGDDAASVRPTLITITLSGGAVADITSAKSDCVR
jgi:hypothetical protein